MPRPSFMDCVLVMLVVAHAGCADEEPAAAGGAGAIPGAGASVAGAPSGGIAGDVAGTGGAGAPAAGAAGGDPGGAGGVAASGGSTAAGTGGAGTGGTPALVDAGAGTDAGMLADAGMPGEPVCGTAEENAAVTLSCAPGRIIDGVVFASYGEPAGACGGFSAGACDAATSRSVVEDLCVGRETCTVPATNAVFTDPCNSVVKRLAVEATCVEGTPVTPTRPYKGVANSPCDWRTSLGASWYYNWGTDENEPCADPTAGGEFVPMIWGGRPAAEIESAIAGFAAAGATHVLGFNEPDHSDQANMTVDEAIALWPAFDQPGITVVSPAAASDGRGWFEDFMGRVEAGGLRVDVVAVHWYGWNAGSCDASAAGFESHVAWAESVAGDRPIWITEWGCLNQSAPDEATVIAFFEGALAVLARHPRVERYAFYPWSTNCGLSNPDGSPTALGQAFAAAPAYR